ncbi:phage head closure protein [Methylopila sp. 73B]|uniref:phage head closure protein n=1 Tax=Methylopila sp. 73B TaxID=1120792 RepID=UPI00037DFF63|nr:phage head closure protein [Methylopila sp. 73B]
MRAGKLDHQITIERAGVASIDDMGVPTDAWATVATMRAQVVTADADEFLTGAGTAAAETILFRIRWTEGVRQTDRVRHAGRSYGILGVVEIGRRRGLEIRATTKAPDA